MEKTSAIKCQIMKTVQMITFGLMFLPAALEALSVALLSAEQSTPTFALVYNRETDNVAVVAFCKSLGGK